MKVVDVLWFTNRRGTVGLAIVEENITGDRKGYIGAVAGENETADTEELLAWGASFSLKTAQDIVKRLTKEADHDVSTDTNSLDAD